MKMRIVLPAIAAVAITVVAIVAFVRADMGAGEGAGDPIAVKAQRQ